MSLPHVIVPASNGAPARVEANPLLAPGQRGYSYVEKRSKIGDGVRRWDALPTFAEDDPVLPEVIDRQLVEAIAETAATRERGDLVSFIEALLNPGL
jgi:hypothetical protein